MDEEPNLFRFDSPQLGERRNLIGRYGDHLSLRFYVHYLNNAFDPIQHDRNDWKLTPTLERVAVDYLRETIVHRYEEYRR